MLIFPAIDLKDGRVVRLYKGDFDTVHQVAEDPVETARQFYAAGARYLHMVDLDGARDGARKNGGIVQSVARVGLKVELGGGIRSMADLEEVFSWGSGGRSSAPPPSAIRILSGQLWRRSLRRRSPWASTPGTAWSAPPAGWRTRA